VAKVKAIVFDVDGTLYNQTLLRILVAGRMFFSFIASPKQFSHEFKIIKEFRKIQEKLRESDLNFINEMTQVKLTSEKLRLNYDDVSKVINKWFNEIPLSLISICKKNGLIRTLSKLSGEGYKLGLFSDYSSEDKAEALGIKGLLEVIVCSSDSDVGKLKPASIGFVKVAEKLNLKTNEIVYVGDRFEVDITGAENAGMIPLLIGKISFRERNYHSCYRFKSITGLIKKINDKIK